MNQVRRNLMMLLVLLLTIGIVPGLADSDPPPKIYLPFITSSNPDSVRINGTVLDVDSEPVPNVTILDDYGESAQTDETGQYTLSTQQGENTLTALRPGFAFVPQIRYLDVNEDVGDQDFSAEVACGDILVNGTVIAGKGGWEFVNADVSSSVYFSAPSSGRTGGSSGSSYANSQIYRIPSDADSALLSAIIKREYSGSLSSGDGHWIQILDENDAVLESLAYDSANTDWEHFNIPLNQYVDQSIRIQFKTQNDGSGSTASMFFDEVQLVICTTDPDLAAGCNQVDNPSFEVGTLENADDWTQVAAISPVRTSVRAKDGTFSMRTGIPESYSNTAGYSEVYQEVTIPASAPDAVLSFWIYTTSNEVVLDADPSSPLGEGEPWGDILTPVNDTQYAYIMTPSGTTLKRLFWWTASDTDGWVYLQFNASAHIGQTVRILFGTYNNGIGGKTGMWVDKVRLNACAPPPPPPPACNIVLNSGFEDGVGTDADDWEQTVSIAAERTSIGYYAGTHSMQTGIPSGDTNTAGYSQFYQDVAIPAGAVNAVLSYWVYTNSSETPPDLMPDPPPLSADIYGPASPDYDTQFGYLQTTSGDNLKRLFWWTASDSDSWNFMQFDVSNYRGQTIRVLFGTYNNGIGGKTGMWVDEVYLDACDPPPTPPPACNIVLNSGFEDGVGTDADDWEQTVSIAAERTSIGYYAGTHSMQTGIPSGDTNTAGYSQFYQDVAIPAGAVNAVLSYWVYTNSSETPPDLMPDPPPLSADIYGPASPDYDTQFGYLQTTSGDNLKRLFWWTASDSDSWNFMQFDVSNYRGQTIRVLFGTYNNGIGGKTGMWVDEVYLDACP